jgi:hypothetical protein
MTSLRFLILGALAIALSQVPTAGIASAQSETPQMRTQQQVAPMTLRSIPANRARLVSPNQLVAPGGRSAVTCCTNWNTSTGGTGCATFPDTCPADQFEVDCGASGCW